MSGNCLNYSSTAGPVHEPWKAEPAMVLTPAELRVTVYA